MSHPQAVLLVKFKTKLSHAELMEIVHSRAGEFRALSGLKQKYYLHDANTGEYAGLYLWESAQELDAYRQSELRASIGAAYQTIGAPDAQVFDVIMPLRDKA